MKVEGYEAVWSSHPDDFSERVSKLIRQGYELYGPPIFTDTKQFGTMFAQVLILPVEEVVPPKKQSVLPMLSDKQGSQSCGDCDCSPNPVGEARKSCGRLG